MTELDADIIVIDPEAARNTWSSQVGELDQFIFQRTKGHGPAKAAQLIEKSGVWNLSLQTIIFK